MLWSYTPLTGSIYRKASSSCRACSSSRPLLPLLCWAAENSSRPSFAPFCSAASSSSPLLRSLPFVNWSKQGHVNTACLQRPPPLPASRLGTYLRYLLPLPLRLRLPAVRGFTLPNPGRFLFIPIQSLLRVLRLCAHFLAARGAFAHMALRWRSLLNFPPWCFFCALRPPLRMLRLAMISPPH